MATVDRVESAAVAQADPMALAALAARIALQIATVADLAVAVQVAAEAAR